MSYAYNCDMYCDDCAEDIKAVLDSEGCEDSGDTNEYPQYANNDESDSPQHCNECSEFLENALTIDGYNYVADLIEANLNDGEYDSLAVTEWAQYYGIGVVAEIDIRAYDAKDLSDKFDVAHYRCIR